MAEADCDLYIISPEFSLNPAQQKLRKAIEVNIETVRKSL